MGNQGRGKTVLITGASTGIGRATALRLDRHGFRVFASVRNQRDAQALQQAGSERLCPILMDVTDPSSIDRARHQVGEAVSQTGLWGLVNNAGIGFIAPLECVPLDQFRRTFEVNVFGLLAVTQAFLPYVRQASGRLVNISSTASLVVAPFHGTYSASKLSVNGITNALRLELKPFNVQVSNVICGSIRTPIWEKAAHLGREVSQAYTPESVALYGRRLNQMGKYFNKIGGEGAPPEAAAARIAHALTSPHARSTYFVGGDAYLDNILSVLLHGRLRDWIILQVTGVNA